MKKLIACSLSAFAFAATAAEPLTLEQIKENYTVVLSVAETNRPAAGSLAIRTVVNPLNDMRIRCDAVVAFAEEVDAKLLEMGAVGPYNWATAKEALFHGICQKAFDRSGAETNCPYAVSLGRKYETYCGPLNFRDTNATFDENVGLLNENLDLVNGKCRLGYNYMMLDFRRKYIQSASVKYVKKFLRRQGKSFVTKDGVNPCESYMTELNTALNAPYFEGLNAWFEKIGIAARVDVSKLPPKRDVLKLKEEILDADRILDANSEFILKVCLGVDGYNAFVREYNGED